MGVAEIRKYLYDGYEKDFFDECIKNLSDKGSRIRLSNFAYSLRELVREVLADRAPDERIKNCCWYKPEYNEKGQELISRKHRMKYAIQGGLPDSIVKDEMKIVVDETTKEVKKQIDRLSKYTHITRDVFYSEDDIETLAVESLEAVDELFRTVADARDRFGDLVIDKINDEIFDTFLYNTINEIDSLSTHHTIHFFHLEESEVIQINDDNIFFHAKGRVYVRLQYGSNMDLKNDLGYEMDVDFPFEAVFGASIPKDLDDLMLSQVNFEVDTNEFFDVDAAIKTEMAKKGMIEEGEI